jgi:hypothetical protein
MAGGPVSIGPIGPLRTVTTGTVPSLAIGFKHRMTPPSAATPLTKLTGVCEMGYWITSVEKTPKGKFYLAMTEYDYADLDSVTDVDEPAVSAGREFDTESAALDFAFEHEIIVR